MKLYDAKGNEVSCHWIGKTISGNRICGNPGPGYRHEAEKGERIREDRDGNLVVSKRCVVKQTDLKML